MDTKSKRDVVDIFAEILELCKQPTAKTRIMYKTYTSYASVSKFLNSLQKIEMLKFNDSGKKYETTEKGFAFLKKYSELQKIIENQSYLREHLS